MQTGNGTATLKISIINCKYILCTKDLARTPCAHYILIFVDPGLPMSANNSCHEYLTFVKQKERVNEAHI